LGGKPPGSLETSASFRKKLDLTLHRSVRGDAQAPKGLGHLEQLEETSLLKLLGLPTIEFPQIVSRQVFTTVNTRTTHVRFPIVF
jgi:hypothetical protein